MSIKALEFEGLRLRAKAPVPFVEENPYLPEKVYIEGYFPAGTVCTLISAVCSQKIDPYGKQVSDYCHAAALRYTGKDNGEVDDTEVIFHVDLSCLFLLFDPIDKAGNVIPL